MNTTALAVSFHVFRCVLVDCRPPSAPMLSSLLPSGIRRILTGTPTKPGWCFLDLTKFNKIAIEATAQMAADKEAIDFSRVHMYESKCILPLRDNCLLCS